MIRLVRQSECSPTCTYSEREKFDFPSGKTIDIQTEKQSKRQETTKHVGQQGGTTSKKNYQMKLRIPKQLVAGWLLSILVIQITYRLEAIPPKFTEFYEGDIALSYSVHDTVPQCTLVLSYDMQIQICHYHMFCDPHTVTMSICLCLYT